MSENECKYPMLEDEGIRRMLIESDALNPPNTIHMTAKQQRAQYNDLSAHFGKPRPQSVRVSDHKIAGDNHQIPIRIYSPDTKEQTPVVFYIHGGGFVVGDLESHDDICGEICERANVTVFGVEYRLAPEHKYPAAYDDCKSVLNAIDGFAADFNFDSDRLVLAGDSAGGNLAAALCLYARDTNGPAIKGQVLVYAGLGGDTSKGSYISRGGKAALTAKDIDFKKTLFIGDVGVPGYTDKYAFPLLETDFSGLPPAFLSPAHFDPLCDDSEQYASLLRSAGIPAKVREEKLLVHAFLRGRHMSKAAGAAFSAIIEAIKSLAYQGSLPK
ncbi:MAG: alpha/beta hydrolase [Rhizobiaceae bacterium]|nr:alpha/beta hydrolase [Rhizobiaceae bacterium]